MSFDLTENLKNLPAEPGVYLHKDKYGEVIYVGKATSLKNRVRQYFHLPAGLDAKTQVLVKHIAEFEYIVTNTEAEALILENTLIKKHRPRFNVMLLDDKTYPYLKITYGETYPRLVKTRTLSSDGSKYFGPYADVGALNRIIGLLNDSYRLKRCAKKTFPPGWRPCLNGFVGACDRCCTEEAPSPEEYALRIEGVAEFLKGRDKKLVADLKNRMQEAADSMDFETAAKCRDLIVSAEAVTARQKVDLLSSGSMDICLATEADLEKSRSARMTVFFVREGRLTGREIHRLDAEEGASKKEITAAFLKQYYTNQTMFPKEILLEEKIEDMGAIEEFLSEAAGHRIRLIVPERGDKRALLMLAQKDIRETEALAADLLMAKKDRETAAEDALRKAAGLPERAGATSGEPSQAVSGRPSPIVGESSPVVPGEPVGERARAASGEAATHDESSPVVPGESAGEPSQAVSGRPSPIVGESSPVVPGEPSRVVPGEPATSDESSPVPGEPSRAVSGEPSRAVPEEPATSDESSPVMSGERVRALRIEAFDVSHTGGENSVGVMVVFSGAEKSRSDYRRFKIRTKDDEGKSADDYASMQEVIYRRLRRGLAGDKGFDEMPDVILVDGGKGHVTAAEQIINALKMEQLIPVLGMVKDDKHRTRGLVSATAETELSQTPELYHLIGDIQEEVHRFAVDYHRGVRGKSLAKSELDEIPGIGEKRRRALLVHFGSLEKIRAASKDELSQVPGMNKAAAEAVAAWSRS